MQKQSVTPVKRPGKTVRWRARWRDAEGQTHYFGTYDLRRHAQDEGDRKLAAFLATPVLTSRATVGAYAEDWTDRFPRAARTDAENNHRLSRVLDVEVEGRKLRDWPWTEVRRSHANALVDHLLRVDGRSVVGARNILSVLSAMTEDAIREDDLLAGNPFKGLRLRADDRRTSRRPREQRVWSFEEMHAFAAAAGQYEPMIRMLADTGMRIGELLGLQRELQDLRAGVFSVRGSAWNGQLVESSREKNHDREGPIPPGCLALLRAMPTRIDSPWLFSTPGSRRVGNAGRDRPGGLLWRYDNWRRQVWLPTCEAAGCSPAPKEFRASFNTHLLAEGVDRADLADMLGHSEDVNAERYTRALRRSGDRVRKLVG